MPLCKSSQLNQEFHSLLICFMVYCGLRSSLNSVTLTAHPFWSLWAKLFSGLAHSPSSLVWAYLRMTHTCAIVQWSKHRWKVYYHDKSIPLKIMKKQSHFQIDNKQNIWKDSIYLKFIITVKLHSWLSFHL